MPIFLPIAISLGQTPSQAITYAACVALGLSAAGISPISSSGAAFLSILPEAERDEYSDEMFRMAFIGPAIMAVVAAVGGMNLFSNLLTTWYK